MADEVDIALAVAPHIANKFIALWGNMNVRIVFGDQARQGGATSYHTHIAMNHEDVRQLIDILQQLETQFIEKSGKINGQDGSKD